VPSFSVQGKMKKKLTSTDANSDLQRFAESFSSEAELRERLATLFSKIRGIDGVQVTHGGWPILAFFARVGITDLCSLGF
jgi:hypothetical protein